MDADVILRRLARYFDERLGTGSVLRAAARKIYPDHWSFFLGEFALYAFVVLVATGVWLTFVYDASPANAYASVAALNVDAPVGYLIRQLHHWSAVAFVAAILVHMARIFFTGAFRKPRETNWVVGVLLLILASLTGFTGYSLPNDALSGVGVRIADAVMLSVPVAGRWAADVLNGGGYPGPLLFTHLYTIHVFFLPVTIAALIAAHLAMVVRQKHTQFVPDPAHVVGRRFWPDYALRSASAFGVTVAVLLALAATVEINPIARYGPYHDWTTTNPATPDWYAAFLDGALRLGPSATIVVAGHPIPGIFWPGVVMPLVVFALVIAWPWIDRRLTGDVAAHDVLAPPSGAPLRTGVGVALIAAGIVLTLAADDDQQSRAFHVSVEALVTLYRIALPVVPVVAGCVAALFCIEFAAHRAHHRRARVVVRRSAAGGYDDGSEPA